MQERGALKEYEFAKRLEQLWYEEQRLRVPVAQGLPWTTDEPNVRFSLKYHIFLHIWLFVFMPLADLDHKTSEHL
jgi:hypothetical protein